jgi:hypothetical protein
MQNEIAEFAEMANLANQHPPIKIGFLASNRREKHRIRRKKYFHHHRKIRNGLFLCFSDLSSCPLSLAEMLKC